jgi:hypothetical protein
MTLPLFAEHEGPTLLFTRPGETGFRFTDRVEVEWQGPHKVRMALVRDVPRTSPAASGGRMPGEATNVRAAT